VRVRLTALTGLLIFGMSLVLELLLAIDLAAVLAWCVARLSFLRQLNMVFLIALPILLIAVVVVRIRELDEAKLHDAIKQRRGLLRQLATLLSKKREHSFPVGLPQTR